MRGEALQLCPSSAVCWGVTGSALTAPQLLLLQRSAVGFLFVLLMVFFFEVIDRSLKDITGH